ncbi:rapid alkalinization factor 23-like [Triticum urartu]|uniref:rapid alkalinization factor 23-like n=1 Tax=Triticum dicoccoides TaxID=85692 RepID=UPI00162DB0EE|nr:rapid alkalinization factor 23-like [Triticum dicoccoides]XP_048553670.1 rapid alkalinization factor 23-like [Triticum urartu]
MPTWAATPVLLLLLLLLQGRGGHGAIGISSLDMDMDMDMGVEAAAHGRLLWASGGGRRYISYDALRGDAVPCSRPGVPYYNCRVSTTANPYSRGCESITRCRDDDPS